ncbi:phosphotransferase family protein [Dactylosporangium sp. NPDC051484]|uniref:phosphotransferase family protein n=1 Tax=Dactylosporangium sp. NPDC051484 TaxID=3154942 RepID=UPI00344E20A9
MGGRSNLTYRLSDGTSSWVMRTPPRAGQTPSAHDIPREYRVTRALATTCVPVPRAVTLCDDTSIIGVPFAVAELVEGRTIRAQAELDTLDDASVDAITVELVETLAALHQIDHVAVGLQEFGRPDRYAERQVGRWARQWEIVGDPRLERLASEVSAGLMARLPDQQSAAIIHGDYRIDNTIVTNDSDRAPRIAAVLDWELSTIGDPVADVAMMCAYRYPVFDLIVGSPAAWTSPRLRGPAELAGLYEKVGGATLVAWNFHLALAYFKIGVIAAGIDHRARAGAASGIGFDTAGESVEVYLQLAHDRL